MFVSKFCWYLFSGGRQNKPHIKLIRWLHMKKKLFNTQKEKKYLKYMILMSNIFGCRDRIIKGIVLCWWQLFYNLDTSWVSWGCSPHRGDSRMASSDRRRPLPHTPRTSTSWGALRGSYHRQIQHVSVRRVCYSMYEDKNLMHFLYYAYV